MDKSDSGVSRRGIIGSAGAGLAIAASGAGVASAQPENLQSPVDKYPKPPFPVRRQAYRHSADFRERSNKYAIHEPEAA